MERLILCGGGHVSLEAAYLAAHLEFEVTVIDDRAEFANRERFPMAAQVICAPFLEALDGLGSREDDYYVILTRGHAYDSDCLARILRGKYAYVGMIGSKVKVAAVMERMRALGFSPKTLDGVHSPVGLAIGAQTPAEIGISILAEIIAVRAKRGPTLPPPPSEPGVLVTIVEKHGSAPRGVGTWMLVRPDGSCVGTIGGGAVEFQAKQDALSLLASGTRSARKGYDLSHAAAELGMVCGGSIVAEFQVR
ncbi:XdhC family protein [Pseudoflavonifractor phocaeensis]|uniref:XdhC family protein n=1 Tax=Pseudoflavonifractor phocaeensis TaxID=1870988 RepID=UPI00195BD67E|nr:XdhC/CoxI family protein [Pseudoflavonifractor phocaeensis]MBM6939076.1 XdhC family protein [Pseudoflavonifractor phocaeensis]